MFEEQAVLVHEKIANVRQENGTPVAASRLPDILSIFKVESIEIAGDQPIEPFQCKSPEQFQFIQSALNSGFALRVLENGRYREVEIRPPGENSNWESLNENFISVRPSDDHPIFFNRYLTERNEAIALDLATRMIQLDFYKPVAVCFPGDAQALPAVAAHAADIAENLRDTPYAMISRARELGIIIYRTEALDEQDSLSGRYVLGLSHNNEFIELGKPFLIKAATIGERDQEIAHAVSLHLQAPPLLITNVKRPSDNPLVIDAHEDQALCATMARVGVNSITISNERDLGKDKNPRSTEKLVEISLNFTDGYAPITFSLPYRSAEEFRVYLKNAILSSISLDPEGNRPVTMLCGQDQTPYPVLEKLEPELHRYLSEIGQLGYAIIDQGNNTYALKNLTSILNRKHGDPLSATTGETDFIFSCDSALSTRGAAIKSAIENFIVKDKKASEENNVPRQSELLTRRGIANTIKALEQNEDLFKLTQLGVTLRLNFSDMSEGHNRLGLYYRYAQAFSEILVKHRTEGDPTVDEIRQVQIPAFDTVVELYISQVPSIDKADIVPEYIKAIGADQKISDDHVLIKLGMSATRLVLEDRERMKDQVILSDKSKVLLLRGREEMFSSIQSISNDFSSVNIKTVSAAEYQRRLKSRDSVVEAGELLTPTHDLNEKQANKTLRDFISKKGDSNSVLYLFSHAKPKAFHLSFGQWPVIQTGFFNDLVQAAITVQQPAAKGLIDLSHLTIICNGCTGGAFATYIHSVFRQAIEERGYSTQADKMPLIMSGARDRSVDWVYLFEENGGHIYRSKFIETIFVRENPSPQITIGDLVQAADKLNDQLKEKQTQWEFREISDRRHYVRRVIHGQVPIISGGSVFSVNEMIYRLQDASERTGHSRLELPKSDRDENQKGVLTIPRQKRLSQNSDHPADEKFVG